MLNYLDKNNVMFAVNIWDINSARAVMEAAKEKGQNIILQTSSSVFGKMQKKQLREYVTSYAGELGIEAYLHLDHCKDLSLIEEAISFGWDSVMIDASDKTLEENICITNKVVELAHKEGILVEAEIGQVKGVEDDMEVKSALVADKKDIGKFCDETQIDMLAVAFGNAHGIYEGEPELDYELMEYSIERSGLPFVVHGGSGLQDDVMKKLIDTCGVKKINISTDVKVAYRTGILNAFQAGAMESKGFQAVNVEKYIQAAIREMVCTKLDLLKM